MGVREDITVMYGNTTIIIIAPKITEEENERRWEAINKTGSQIIANLIARNEL